MPIVFVHGAGTREYSRRYNVDWENVEQHLRQYVAPVMAIDPENVEILLAYWGDLGTSLAWDGASIPQAPWPRLWHARHPIWVLFSKGKWGHIFWEIWNRATAILGYYASKLIAFGRRPQSKQTATFLGDALHYLNSRGVAPRPGPIPARVLAVLAEAHQTQQDRPGEPLVVVSHSLGGLIVYDIVTHFLPNMADYAGLRIDHWTSISTQIGLFEEMKLFLASDPQYGPDNPVPFPDRHLLGGWWNLWDPHDFLSFKVAHIIDGVEDDLFNSGLSLAGAHLACLKMSSFYILVAEKLRETINRTEEQG
jgi:hypothetical protein